MILDKLYNKNNIKILKTIIDPFIREVAEKNEEENIYLICNIYDEDRLNEDDKSFLINIKNDLKLIDVCVQKKIYNDLTNVVFDVTYGNVYKSKETPFILDSCFFRLYFDLSDDEFMNKKPYDIQVYYTSAFSDNLKEYNQIARM